MQGLHGPEKTGWVAEGPPTKGGALSQLSKVSEARPPHPPGTPPGPQNLVEIKQTQKPEGGKGPLKCSAGQLLSSAPEPVRT